MNAQEYRNISDLRPDPDNATIFDGLEGEDLQDLAESIRKHGLINPITIRPDGRIIAGEQRWRAANVAKMKQVPVIVRDASDEEVEVLRIEENLRRRVLKPSETARAVRRLYVLYGITERKGAGRPKEEIGIRSIPISEVAEAAPAMTVAAIAEKAGVSSPEVKRLNTLANLISDLATLLDSGEITKAVAYQLAQMAAEDQEVIARLYGTHPLGMPDEAELRDIKKRLANADAREAELSRLAAAEARHEEEKAVAMEHLTRELRAERDTMVAEKDATIEQLEESNRKLQRELDRVDHWQRHDKMHTFLQQSDRVMTLDARTVAYAPQGIDALRTFLENDKATAEALSAWTADYAHHLGERLGGVVTTLRSVK